MIRLKKKKDDLIKINKRISWDKYRDVQWTEFTWNSTLSKRVFSTSFGITHELMLNADHARVMREVKSMEKDALERLFKMINDEYAAEGR